MRWAALTAPPNRLGGVAESIVVASDSTRRIGRVAPARAGAGFSTGKRRFSTGTDRGVAKDRASEDEVGRVCPISCGIFQTTMRSRRVAARHAPVVLTKRKRLS